MSENRRRIIRLDEVPEEERRDTCFYCYCPKHRKHKSDLSRAVAAVEVTAPTGRLFYYGICGNHAEVYPRTEEEEARKPMLCPLCYPR